MIDNGKFCTVCGTVVEIKEPTAPLLQEFPVAVDVPEAKKPSHTVLKTILSVFLCMLAFVFLLGGVCVCSIRVSTTEAGVEELVENIQLSDFNVNIANGEEPVALADWLYEELKESFPDRIFITQKQLIKMIDKGTFKPFLTKKTCSLVQDLYQGTAKTEITEEELEELLRENGKLLEDDNMYIPERDAVDMSAWIAQSDFAKMFNAGDFRENMPAYRTWRLTGWLLSVPTVVILFVLGGLMLFFVFRVNKKRISRAEVYTGWTLLAVSGVYMIFWLVAKMWPFFLEDTLSLEYYISLFADHVLSGGFWIAIIVLILAIGWIFIGKLSGRRKK